MIWDFSRIYPTPFSVGHGPLKALGHHFSAHSGVPLSDFMCGSLLPLSGLIYGLLEPLFVPGKSRRDMEIQVPLYLQSTLICMFYRCREGASINVLPNPAHTQRTKTHTPQNSNASFLLYALQCWSSGLPCRALRVQSSPSVFRSDATVARSVRTHTHTPDGPWRIGCRWCFFLCVVFVLPQMWAHLRLAVALRLPLCWQVLPHLWTQGSYSQPHTHTHIYTHTHTHTRILTHWKPGSKHSQTQFLLSYVEIPL